MLKCGRPDQHRVGRRQHVFLAGHLAGRPDEMPALPAPVSEIAGQPPGHGRRHDQAQLED
jgi:hypothetical protein